MARGGGRDIRPGCEAGRRIRRLGEEEPRSPAHAEGHPLLEAQEKIGNRALLGLAQSGKPLDPETRAEFEPRLGLNLGGVRVHTDRAASASAEAVGARAYTLGRDVVFGPGEYRPGTEAGRELLAHELTHVAQQAAAPAGRGPVLQRAPKVGGFTWTVDHSDVATGSAEDNLVAALAGLTGDSATVTKAYVGVMKTTAAWAIKADLYVRAIDFLRDNRGLFSMFDYWNAVREALAYCDRSTDTVSSLTDAWYEVLLAVSVYSAASGTATFTHSSGSTHAVPERPSGTVEFYPSGRDSLVRPVTSVSPITGGFGTSVDLLAGYGAEPGAVSDKDANALIKRHASRVPSKLRPYLIKLAADGTIHAVLDKFLGADKGQFKLEPVGMGGAHYSNSKPPSIEVDEDLFPGSGADREETELGLRTTLLHELYHYALDRADAVITEVGQVSDHDLIATIEDRYRIIERLRAGQSPVQDDIEAFNGYVGGDHKPKLNRLLAADDRAGLKTYVGKTSFIEGLVYTRLVGPLSHNEVGIKSGPLKDFLFDPGQVTDLAYLAAVNAVLIKRALEIAADTADKTKTPLASIWSNKTYQSAVLTFIRDFMALVKSNKTAGADALAKTL